MKYRLIDAEKPHHAVSRLARVLGVSRSGYHAWRHRRPSAHSLADAALRERIEAIHESSRGVYGALAVRGAGLAAALSRSPRRSPNGRPKARADRDTTP